MDESGYGDTAQPALVMVGIVVDHNRANKTRQEFGVIFDGIKAMLPAATELKSSRVFYGAGLWGTVAEQARWQLFVDLCMWIKTRKHKLVLAAVDKERLANNKGLAPGELHDEFLAAAMHIALQIQKAHKGQAKNKGHTFLIFDENKQKVDTLPKLLNEAPAWTDSYYNRAKKSDPLDQVIDTAFFAKSHIVGLVQVADFFAFVLRRYAELEQWKMAEKVTGEADFIRERAKQLAALLGASGWAKSKASECASWYRSVAPESLLELTK